MSVTAPQGWLAAGVHAGTKPSGDLDLALVVSDRPATVAGAFTTSKIPSAHVQLCRPRVATGHSRGFCVSAGIANAFTGSAGLADAEAMASAAAKAVDVAADEMLVAATGTIGDRLPIELVTGGINAAAQALSSDGGADAANAIRTTDAYEKTAVRTVDVDGVTVTIGGMAKGAGMIAPRMVPQATLLVFVTTDATASADTLRGIVARSLPVSFNAITVDGCMSTSDTVLLFANGASGVDVDGSPGFEAAVTDVMRGVGLRRRGRRRGREPGHPGAGGRCRLGRRRATPPRARSPAPSCCGARSSAVIPSFGRIVQALGQADVALDPDLVRVSICGVELSVGGVATGGTEKAAKALTAGGDVVIGVDLGLGSASFEYLTCDLTPDYVRFNAEYTT